MESYAWLPNGAALNFCTKIVGKYRQYIVENIKKLNKIKDAEANLLEKELNLLDLDPCIGRRVRELGYYYFKEIWTPLKYLGIRLFYEPNERKYWIKAGNYRRRRLLVKGLK